MNATNTKRIAPDQQMITTSPKSFGEWWTFEKVTLFIIILLTTFFRLFLLGDRSLWGDEINIANRAFGNVSSLGSGNAWLYPPMLKLFAVGLGPDDFFLRLPAALVSIATIPLIYSTGKLFFNGHVGLLSAFLLAISPIHINYSQEAHSYALFAFLSLLSFYYLWLALEFNRQRSWLVFGLVIGLNINVHFYTFFVLLSALVVVVVLTLYQAESWSFGRLWRDNRQRLFSLFAAFGLVVLLSIPVLVQYVVPQSMQVIGITPRTGRLLARTGTDRLDISPELFENLLIEFPLWRYPQHSLLYEIFWGMFLVGLIYLLIKERAKFLALVIWITVPLLPIAIFALSAGIDFSTRRLIFILPVCLITIAVGFIALGQLLDRILAKLAGVKLPTVAIITTLTIIAFGWLSFAPLHWYYYQSEKRDWKRTALLLEKVAQPNDVIITQASFVHPETSELDYYYGGPVGSLIFMNRDDLTPEFFGEKYDQHGRLWYVRKLVQQDNLIEIEDWLHKNDLLIFAFGGEGVGLDYEGLLISYGNKNTTSEEQKLAEWQEILEQAFEIKPDRWYTYEALSDLYIRQRKYEKAIALWNQYLTANPGDATAYLGLAKVYEAGGQPDDAFAQIKEVIKIAPGDLRLYNTLNYVLRSRGGTEQALADIYQQLQAVDPAVAHFALALYYANASQHETAIREFQTVIELAPRHEVAQEARRWLSLYE